MNAPDLSKFVGTSTPAVHPAVAVLAQRLQHGLVVMDEQGAVVWLNDAFATLTGRASDEVLGGRLDELLGWDASAGGVAAATLRATLDSGTAARHVLLLCRLDGQRFWASVDLQPLGSEPSLGPCWAATLVDLSGRQVDADQLQQMIDGAAVPITVRDEGGTVVECNIKAQALFGMGAERILGSTLQELPWRVTDGEGVDLLADWLPEVVTLQTGQPIQDFPIGVLLPDGRRRWVNVTTTLVARSAGQPPWVATQFHDVTEHREMQADLDRQWRRLLAALEGSRTSTWEWNLETGETHFDDRAAEMIGQPPEAMWPPDIETWRRFAHPEDLAASRALLLAHFDGQTDYYEQEARLRHADGSWRWVRDRGRLGSRTAEGKPEWMYGTREDITERKQAEQAAARDHALLQSLFDLAPIGIELVDLGQRRSVLVNETLCRITGHDRAALIESGGAAVLCADWLAQREKGFADAQAHGRFGPVELESTHASGRRIALVVNGVLVSVAGLDDHVWLTVQDVTAARAMERELRAAANEDRLTGLANRAALLRELHSFNRRAQGEPERAFSVFFLDFDRFKLVNDTLGHDAGDELLRGIAHRLRESSRLAALRGAREAWLPARLGGDEFVILAPGVADTAGARREAEGLLGVLAEPYTVKHQQIHSSASIGIALWRPGLDDAEELLRDADIAMYEAKRQGRRRAVFFDEQMHERISRTVRIETALRHAVEGGELFIVYQPIVDLDTGAMTSVEALLRWKHPTLGTVAPTEFIPIAEESGHILEIGEWVLREACRQWAIWRQESLERAPQTVSVNLSRVQLTLGNRLLATVRSALDEVGMPPSALQLEITEREVMRDQAGTRDLMLGLRALGVKLAMDDFGTGASSLGCLREYRFDTIKIDKSFVTGLCQDPQVMAVAHATVSVIANLGMLSVAEGIEDPSEVAALQAMGCRFGQGFLFARPMAPERLLKAMHPNMP